MCLYRDRRDEAKGPKGVNGFRVWLLVGTAITANGVLLLVFLYLQNRHRLYPREYVSLLVWVEKAAYYGALIVAPILWMAWALVLSPRIVAPALKVRERKRSRYWETFWLLPALLLPLGFMYAFVEPLQKMGILSPYRYPVEYFIGIVILAPLYEEMVFRRVLFAHLTTKMTVLKAALLSSVVFALAHFGSYHPLPWSEFLGGLLFCGLYFWRKSLIAPIAAHMGGNLAMAITEMSLLR